MLTEHGQGILGYYTLAAASLEPGLPGSSLARGLPRTRPIPALLLGRLAVATSRQGCGFGQTLLADALTRANGTALEVGCRALVVDAKPAAIRFYENFGFTRLTDSPTRLFMLLTPAP